MSSHDSLFLLTVCFNIDLQTALCNVWRTTSEMWESVAEKRVELQNLRLKLKLNSVLKEQVMHFLIIQVPMVKQIYVLPVLIILIIIGLYFVEKLGVHHVNFFR